ncbi:MAG: hypothetical protein B9S32_09615 [Verrucomicrobia bacterium Tous-C9LFEB]|nr:MAG: hypothetical protein B9S32_09615 [Verrucomicrobia bacterium Tous-C9LFEB]
MSRLNSLWCRIAYGSWLLAIANPSQAELVWKADFEDPAKNSQTTLVEAGGQNNTFSAIKPGGLMTLSECKVVTGGTAPKFMKGGVLYVEAVNSGGENGLGAVRLTQASLRHFTPGNAVVLSYDLYYSADQAFSIGVEARTSRDQRLGNTLYIPNLPKGVPLRITVVVNRGGDPVTLPGDLGALEANRMATYYYDGSRFSRVEISDAISFKGEMAGFAISLSLSKLKPGGMLAVWYDHFGIWTQASDLVDGVSVLKLPPGTGIPQV